MGSPIESTPLVDQIYADIKKKILIGEFAPDTKLTTAKLCALYQTSDTPIKQALNRLVTDGLVEAIPRRGMHVCAVDKKRVEDSYEARHMIELYAAPYVIAKAKASDGFVRELQQLIEAHARLVSTMPLDTYTVDAQQEIDLSIRFHLAMVEATENALIVSMYKNITNYTYIYYRSNTKKSEQIRRSMEEHQEILACIKNLDTEGLKAALDAHLENRRSKIRNML